MGLTNALQNSLMPKINNMITGTRGYGMFVEGMQFDTSLQQEPTMEEGFLGLEMAGMFSPEGGPDLEPKDVEMNATDITMPVHDAKDERDDFEVFFH